MKKYIHNIIIISCMFFTANVFSQTEHELIKEFVKGNINEKTQILETANNDGNEHVELWITALDFTNNNYGLLSKDSEYLALSRTLIQKSSQNNLELLLPQLTTLFDISENSALILDLLTVFSSITVENDEIVMLVNEYALELSQDSDSVDENLFYLTLETLANFSSASSFSILFDAYVYSTNPEISALAQEALVNLEGGYENQVRTLIQNGSPREKYYTLQLVLNNSKNSDFFKAEMSEKALSSTIISIGDVSAVDSYTVDLQMAAIRELVRISWTRSESLITDFYLSAKSQFEAGSLSDEYFDEIIRAFAALSSSSAGDYLSQYLEELNKRQEENITYSESVVLSVIQSLGLLGNKVAFDALLYTTYLNYPEHIVLAARDALVTLKW